MPPYANTPFLEPSHHDDALPNNSQTVDFYTFSLITVPSVSIPKACVYPFNSSRLQRHTLGKMNISCGSCHALK